MSTDCKLYVLFVSFVFSSFLLANTPFPPATRHHKLSFSSLLLPCSELFPISLLLLSRQSLLFSSMEYFAVFEIYSCITFSRCMIFSLCFSKCTNFLLLLLLLLSTFLILLAIWFHDFNGNGNIRMCCNRDQLLLFMLVWFEFTS